MPTRKSIFHNHKSFTSSHKWRSFSSSWWESCIGCIVVLLIGFITVLFSVGIEDQVWLFCVSKTRQWRRHVIQAAFFIRPHSDHWWRYQLNTKMTMIPIIILFVCPYQTFVEGKVQGTVEHLEISSSVVASQVTSEWIYREEWSVLPRLHSDDHSPLINCNCQSIAIQALVTMFTIFKSTFLVAILHAE